MNGLTRTGVDSWDSKWGSEYDIIKQLRLELGAAFPSSYYCAVKVVGIFINSGLERFEWYLINDNDRDAPVVITTRACIKQTSKKSGKEYYQVSRKPLDHINIETANEEPAHETRHDTSLNVIDFKALAAECDY
jgi:hypothetical protein